MNLLAAQKCPIANGTLFSRIAALRLDNGDANPFGQQPIYALAMESVVELSFTLTSGPLTTLADTTPVCSIYFPRITHISKFDLTSPQSACDPLSFASLRLLTTRHSSAGVDCPRISPSLCAQDIVLDKIPIANR